MSEPMSEYRPPFGLAFEVMSEKNGLEVVRTALQHRARASDSARARLDGRLKRLKVPGFRDASRAMPAKLELPVYDAIFDGDDRLAIAVLRCWEDANPRLRDVVAAQLAEAKIELCKEHGTHRFTGTWADGKWAAQRNAVLDAHDDFSRDDVGLMLILLTGRHPARQDVELPDVVTPRFRRWLDELDALPITAPEWRDAGEFERAVHLIADGKLVEPDVLRV